MTDPELQRALAQAIEDWLPDDLDVNFDGLVERAIWPLIVAHVAAVTQERDEARRDVLLADAAREIAESEKAEAESALRDLHARLSVEALTKAWSLAIQRGYESQETDIAPPKEEA